MTNKGLSTKNLSPDSCSSIYNTIIIPTLTYDMETLNLTPNDYYKLDNFAAKAKSIIYSQSIQKAPNTWTFHELECSPPSVITKNPNLNSS